MKILLFSLFFLTCFAWDEDKDFIMPLAAAAYSDNPNQCWSKVMKIFNDTATFTIYRQYSVRCDSMNDTCFAYIAVDDHCMHTAAPVFVYIVFRGTNNNYAIIENGWNYDEMVPFVIGGKVSKIFFDAFNDLWNAGMKDDLLTLKNKYSPVFVFIGHSLGGAMASLAGATFKNIDSSLGVNVETFGQPRIGDKDFANAYNNLDYLRYQTLRIIHKADIVPHLPQLNLTNYYHHAQEQWLNDDEYDTYYVECDENDGEDPTCSDSLNASDYNMNDHKYYYGREFREYGINGCPDLGTSKNAGTKNTKYIIPKNRSKPYSLKTMRNVKL